MPSVSTKKSEWLNKKRFQAKVDGRWMDGGQISNTISRAGLRGAKNVKDQSNGTRENGKQLYETRAVPVSVDKGTKRTN